MVLQRSVLILPGLGDSGPGHWQSCWEAGDARVSRVQQRDWDAPVRDEWVGTLNKAIEAQRDDVVLVGHSTGAILVAHWLLAAHADTIGKVTGALIVAPSDPQGAHYPAGPSGFDPVPLMKMPFRTIVVASDDDPYASLAWSLACADAWGAESVVLESAGHINVASGHGQWPEGYALLDRLRHG